MAKQVRAHLRDGVAIITLAEAEDRPGAGFHPGLRLALADALDQALANRFARAVLLRGTVAGWPVATDAASDFATEAETPDLRILAEQIATAQKPVVAALAGQISGGGLALALACGWRLADPETRFAAPETARGLLPAGGALVRLARRVGAAGALRLLTSETGWGAAEALVAGLVDFVPDDGSVDAAAVTLALAASDGTVKLPSKDAGLANPTTYLAELSQTRSLLGPEPALAALTRQCEVIEAALLLPGDEAFDCEAVAYADLAETPLAKGLGHSAKAAREANWLAGYKAVAPAVDTLRVGLWQASGGADLAMMLLAAGHEVILGGADSDALTEAFSSVAHVQESAVQAGNLDPATRDADWSRLSATIDPAGFSGADMVIAWADAAKLSSALDPAVPLVVGLPQVDLLPQRTLALRFGTDLSEIILPSPDQADLGVRVAALLRGIGQAVVRGGPGPGGIADYLRAAIHAAAERAVMAGASPAQVDRALTAFGFAEGPFMRADRIGLGALVADLRRVGRAPGALVLFLLAEGQAGCAAGQGFYRYDEAQPMPATGLDAVVGLIRREVGVTPQNLSTADIQIRIMAELANEGARLLQTGAAHRASDIDLVAVRGIGLTGGQGGPMFQADQRGLLAQRKLLRALAAEGSAAPVTLWDVLIKNGRRFADLGTV
ncbi:enoyl-CoA hydratase-related protein [Phaeovulum sp.]|uniref:enoyl-CoA hydratase-related protein n=1 Tax=Phaeovulum sp. TaxID=2934796 RepID=UPI0039E34C0E